MLQDEWDVLKEEFVVGRLFVSVAAAESGGWWDEWPRDNKLFDDNLGRELRDDEIPDHLKTQM